MRSVLAFAKNYMVSFLELPNSCWPRIILSLINATSGGIVFFLSFYFVKILHINIVTAGAMISCYGVGTIAGGFLGGKLSDKFSPSRISIISIFCNAVVFLLFLKLTHVTELILCLMLWGTSSYIFKTANNTFVLRQCKSGDAEKLNAINILYTASNLGMGISAMIVSFFSQYGFHYIFMLFAIMMSLVGCYLIFEQNSQQKNIHLNPVLTQMVEGYHQKDNKIVMLGLGCLFLIGLIIAQLGTTYPIYLHDLFPQMGLKSSGYLFIINTILIVLLQVPVVGYFKHHNKILMMGIGALLYGLGMAMLSVAVYYWIAVLACLVESLGEMIFISLAQLVCYQYADEKKKGESLGRYQSVFATSVVVGPYLGALVYHHFGGKIIWYLSGIIGMVCLIACVVFVKKKN